MARGLLFNGWRVADRAMSNGGRRRQRFMHRLTQSRYGLPPQRRDKKREYGMRKLLLASCAVLAHTQGENRAAGKKKLSHSVFPLFIPPLRREPITRLREPVHETLPAASAVRHGSIRHTPTIEQQSACHSSGLQNADL